MLSMLIQVKVGFDVSLAWPCILTLTKDPNILIDPDREPPYYFYTYV
jgi:hypothetical protein